MSSDNILYHHNTERLTTITKINKLDRGLIRSSLRDGLSPPCSGFLHLVFTALNLSILGTDYGATIKINNDLNEHGGLHVLPLTVHLIFLFLVDK